MNEHVGNALPAESKPPSQNGETFEEGQILGGKYQILHLICHGGVGDVYRVRQLFLTKNLLSRFCMLTSLLTKVI